MYFTASADGGKSFAAPVPLLKEPYRTDEKVTPRWPYGTDYISLAAPPDGSFHLLWQERVARVVGSTEAPKDVVARFGVVGPKRATSR